jgi:hypothetical protein
MNVKDFRITGIRHFCERSLFPEAHPRFRISFFRPGLYLVELIGIEPTTSWLQTRRSPS